MTIRQHINRSRRQLIAGAFLSWLGMIALFMNELWNKIDLPWPSVVIFLVLFLAFNLALIFCVRCPRCRNVLGDKMNLPAGGLFEFSPRFKYCPFCGVDFDTEMLGSPAGRAS